MLPRPKDRRLFHAREPSDGVTLKEHFMTTGSRALIAGAAGLALNAWIFAAATGGAADVTKEVRDSVQKLASAIQKGDQAEVKAITEALKSSELEEVMNLMSKRGGKKKAFGVGKTPEAAPPDGIEAKIQNLSRTAKPQAQVEKESADLMEMAYRIAAIAEVAKAKVPEKDEGMKKRADWLEWAGGMRKSAQDLANAAKDKNPGEVKAAAAKLNSACNNCHGTFRD